MECNCGKIVLVHNVRFNGNYGDVVDTKSLQGRPCLIIGEDLDKGIYYMMPMSSVSNLYEEKLEIRLTKNEMFYFKGHLPLKECYLKINNIFIRNNNYYTELGFLYPKKYKMVLNRIKELLDGFKTQKNNGNDYELYEPVLINEIERIHQKKKIR